jgi:membrane-bound ClpP family serine protease
VFGFLTLLGIGFRQSSWEQYAIEDSLQGRTNVITAEAVKVGDKGKALSAIKPAGKARINDDNFEVQAYSDFIDDGEPVAVTKVQGKTIYVQREQEPGT